MTRVREASLGLYFRGDWRDDRVLKFEFVRGVLHGNPC